MSATEMSDERNELERIIAERYHAPRPEPTVLDSAIVSAILAAGYRRPRTITTAEERSILKPGTVCRDEFGNAWKRGIGSWVGTGEDGPLLDDMDLEMAILYVPEQP